MKNFYFYLLGIFFILTGSLSACPDCMGKVSKQSPSFFEEELYTTSKPYGQDKRYHQLNPYPYQYLHKYQSSDDDQQPSLNVDDDDDDLY